MKVLITSVPGFGHLCPLIPLAQALQTAGHDVAFATSAAVAAFIEAAGLAVLPAGPHWLESGFSHTHPNAQPIPGYRNDLATYVEQTVLPQLLDDVATHIQTWKPDVIMSNDFEIAGRTLAEKNHIPFVLLSSGPRVPRALREQWQGPLFAGARKVQGLPVEQPLAYSMRWLHLCFSPQWYGFASDTAYQPADNEFGVRPAVFDGFSQWQNSETITPRNIGLNVLCTLGTVFDKDLRLVRSVVDGVSPHVAHLWLTRNSSTLDTLRDELPDNVHLVNGPLSSLLPKMDVCISHGGTSTLTTALLHGVRNVLIPQGADQIINALVCNQQQLAVGLMNTVTHDANADQGRPLLTPALVRQGFQRLLEEPCYQRNTARYQASAAQLADLEQATDWIEQVVSTGTPLNRSLVETDRLG